MRENNGGRKKRRRAAAIQTPSIESVTKDMTAFFLTDNNERLISIVMREEGVKERERERESRRKREKESPWLRRGFSDQVFSGGELATMCCSVAADRHFSCGRRLHEMPGILGTHTVHRHSGQNAAEKPRWKADRKSRVFAG